MALRDASVFKGFSDAAVVPTMTTLDGVVGDAIDSKIDVESKRTDVKTIKTTIDLAAVINGRTEPVEIIQSGGNLMLSDLCLALEEKDFRVVVRPKKASRDGGTDRVTLSLAWD